MGSVVLELQRDALDQTIRVSDLLRKALVVARKLGLHEFQNWIDAELSGYHKGTDIPEYRELSGQVRGWNPYRGWIPIVFEDPVMAERLSRRKCGQSIAELEHLVEDRGKGSSLHMPFPQDIQRKLCQGFGFDTEVSLFIPSTSIIRILDAVRTIVLNWAIKLEEDGVLGEGLSFTTEEKQAAGKTAQNVTNFYGPVHSPQIQQGSNNAMQISATFKLDTEAVRMLTSLVRDSLDSLGLTLEKRREMEAELRTIDAQLESPNPKSSIIREGLQSIRRILEGAGGRVAGHILLELGKHLL